MGSQVKHNKSELTRQQRQLGMFRQFLPVLKLKKEQLQSEYLRIKTAYKQAIAHFEELKEAASNYVPLLSEDLPFDLEMLLRPAEKVVGRRVIAGLRLPVLESLVFPDLDPPRFGLPTWLPKALPALRTLVRARIEVDIAKEQFQCIDHELRKATQKVNLFEKVLIPQAKEAIRQIQIVLGDQQVAAVCRAKIAKDKKRRAREAAS